MKLTHSILKLNNSKAIGERGPKKGLYICRFIEINTERKKENNRSLTTNNFCTSFINSNIQIFN